MPAAAAAVVGSSVLGAVGSRRAAKRQAQGVQAGMGDVSASRDAAVAGLDPYAQAGQTGLNELMASLGVGGQQSSYQNPMLQQIQQQTLQQAKNRAAATGRNSPADLASMTAESFLQPAYQMQQQRIGQLQGLAGMGYNAASQQGAYNMNAGSSLAGLQGNLGQANAMKSGAPFVAGSSMIGQFGGMLGQQSAGGIPSFGGGFQGGGFGGYGNASAPPPMFTPAAASGLNPNTFSGFGNYFNKQVGY